MIKNKMLINKEDPSCGIKNSTVISPELCSIK